MSMYQNLELFIPRSRGGRDDGSSHFIHESQDLYMPLIPQTPTPESPWRDQQTKARVSTTCRYLDHQARLTSNNPIHRNINTSRITRRITQQIHVRAAQLLHFRQAWDTPVVLQLLFPIRLLRDPIGHRCIHQPGTNTVNPDPILRPLHGQGVRHIPHSRFRSSVWGRRNTFVGPVRGHGSSEDDGTFDVELDESPGCNASAVEGAKQVHIEQSLNLFLGEVEGGFVVRAACVADHPVESTGFLDDLVDGGRDGDFLCDVGLDV